MNLKPLEEHIVRLREELDREKKESNYFQLEKNKIHNYQTISKRKLEEDEAQLKNLEKAVEEEGGRHRLEIKVLKQKMKHLLCEHQNTVSELKAGGSVSINTLQKGQDELEAEFYEDIEAAMVAIQELDFENRVRELELLKVFAQTPVRMFPQQKHEEEMAATRDHMERLLADTKGRNEEKMQVERQKLENLNRIMISEKELHWKRHFAALTEDQNNTLCDIQTTFVIASRDILNQLEFSDEIRQMRKTLGKMKKERHSVEGDNCHVSELITKVEKKITSNQKKVELSSGLQLERDELSESFPRKIQCARDEAGMVSSLLESQLQSLTDDLKKAQAQLHSVLSAPNMDRAALTEVADKAEVPTVIHASTSL
ncbi:dynein regulatory complex subunit 4 [Kryptolebias marmoratus]|uniref:dynein regulatory complex subunit 4 n=1 Tax=Kryptolebias marmoratus TaxID=37003 RepID=UPI0018ACF498|nr:dynein regulatory complex subunit 4 [Kryptolebias marmoratus]